MKMKKPSTILLLSVIIFIHFDSNVAWCKVKYNQRTQKLYNYNPRGQQQGYTQIVYTNNKISRIETRDNGGRRLSVSKAR